MELAKKIQRLRKEHGFTQEQLAEKLFVSRTAISKWETGRGMPSMDSLQMIAKLFNVTLDELLRVEEVIIIAENENKEKMQQFSYYIEGIFNIAFVVTLLLPLYKVEINNIYYSVPLYQFKGTFSIWYWFFTIAMICFGMIQIISKNSNRSKILNTSSQVINICAILLLILNTQPYPAILYFSLFSLKVFVKMKKVK